MSAVFKVTLQDGVSRPAKKAAGSVRDLNRNMRDVRGNARGGSAGLSAIKTGLLAVGAAALVAAAALARVAVGFAKTLVKGAAFMEQQTMAFGLLTKSAELGADVMAETRGLAVELGLPVKETIKQMGKLMAMQFDPAAAREIITMGADMKAMGNTAEEVGSIIRAITQIKAKGKLQAEELTGQLAEAGVSAELVYKELGKTMGKTTDEVKKLITAGKVNADVAIEAIKSAVKQKLGIEKLGQAAQLSTKTLGGMWDVFLAKGEDALLSMSERLTPKLKETFGQVMDFEFDQGKLDGFIDSMIERFDIVKVAIDQVKAAASGWLEGFEESWNELKPVVDDAVEAILEFAGSGEGLQDIKQAFKDSGKVAAVALALLVVSLALATAAVTALSEAYEAVGEAAVEVGEWFEGLGDSISEATEGISGAAGEIGEGIISGIVDGITSGASEVVSAITSVATDAIAAAKAALSESSPSKVFKEIGRNVSLGFAQGIASERGMVAATTAETVTAAPPAASAAATNVSARVSQSPTYNVSGAQSPEATAAAIKELELAELAKAMEQLGNSVGASVG